jgi:hypothetical protein
MKRFRHLYWGLLLGLGLGFSNALAQTEVKPPASVDPSDIGPNVTPRQRTGRVILPDKPQNALVDTGNVRPVRPERDPLSPEVKEKVRTFDKYRDEYLKQQEEIRKRTKGTTDQDRERIREQTKEFRERWREQAKATRQEFRERQKELLERLPSHREVLDNAREQAREILRDRKERRGVE